MARIKAVKPEVMTRQMDLLNERYDLSDRPADGVMMSGVKKPVQDGVRAKLPKDMTWEKLAGITPEEVREKDLWPKGFLPLPHPNHPATTAQMLSVFLSVVCSAQTLLMNSFFLQK